MTGKVIPTKFKRTRDSVTDPSTTPQQAPFGPVPPILEHWWTSQRGGHTFNLSALGPAGLAQMRLQHAPGLEFVAFKRIKRFTVTLASLHPKEIFRFLSTFDGPTEYLLSLIAMGAGLQKTQAHPDGVPSISSEGVETGAARVFLQLEDREVRSGSGDSGVQIATRPQIPDLDESSLLIVQQFVQGLASVDPIQVVDIMRNFKGTPMELIENVIAYTRNRTNRGASGAIEIGATGGSGMSSGGGNGGSVGRVTPAGGSVRGGSGVAASRWSGVSGMGSSGGGMGGSGGGMGGSGGGMGGSGGGMSGSGGGMDGGGRGGGGSGRRGSRAGSEGGEGQWQDDEEASHGDTESDGPEGAQRRKGKGRQKPPRVRTTPSSLSNRAYYALACVC